MNLVQNDHDRVQMEIHHRISRMNRSTTKRLLEAVMEEERDAALACRRHQRCPDRRGYRNGYFSRTLDTRFGPLRLRVPRVRNAPFRSHVFDRYQRRTRRVDRAIEEWVAAGQATRSIEKTLRQAFGNLISAATVSRVIARVDAERKAFRQRDLAQGYRVLWLDAKHGHVCQRRKRGKRGKKTTGVLLSAWGLRWDGREELVAFRACAGVESEENWTAFLTDLEARGLRPRAPNDRPLTLIVTDGHAGLEAALLTVYPHVPKQRCVFHKLRNITEHLVDAANRRAILSSAAAVYHGVKRPAEAQLRLREWIDEWQKAEPGAVRSFTTDFDRTLRYLNLPPALWRRARTTNPIERLHAEMEKTAGRICAWQNLESWERRTWILWRRLRESGYQPTKPNPLFTQDS